MIEVANSPNELAVTKKISQPQYTLKKNEHAIMILGICPVHSIVITFFLGLFYLSAAITLGIKCVFISEIDPLRIILWCWALLLIFILFFGLCTKSPRAIHLLYWSVTLLLVMALLLFFFFGTVVFVMAVLFNQSKKEHVYVNYKFMCEMAFRASLWAVLVVAFWFTRSTLRRAHKYFVYQQNLKKHNTNQTV